MFPFVLIAAVAVIALTSKKKGKGAPDAGMPSLPSGPPRCEVDDSIPEPMRSEIIRLVEQAQKPGLNQSEAQALATAMDAVATPVEFAGYKKLADCIRANATFLHAKAGKLPPGGVYGMAPIAVQVTPKG